jgi:hypothetical protein
MQQTFDDLAQKFGSLSDARGYAMELTYALAHPEEEELDKDQIYAANLVLFQIKAYLAMGDEAL